MTTQISPCLPENIIINILLWLPAKSIGRCRCVSKQWRCFLSQPHFIKTHTHHNRKFKPHQQSLLLSKCFSCVLYYATLDYAHQVFDEMHLTTTKIDSAASCYFSLGFVCCDGLVLTGSEYKLFLINPITNQFKQILFPDKLDSTVYGLGYDSDNHDYKIVTLTNHFDNRVNSAKVYSVKNGAWKNLENRPYDGYFGHGVFINGYIHWFVPDLSQSKPRILSFDLAEEKFYQVYLPNHVTEDIRYRKINDIVLLGGCLCVFSSRFNSETCVWIMKEYGNNDSWTKFTFIVPEDEFCKPICMLDKEHVLVQRDLQHTRKPVTYNLKTGTYKDIVVDGVNPDNIDIRGTFIESLVSPFCNDETS